MTLLELSVGQVAVVGEISASHHGEGFASRLAAMGIVPNKPIQLLRKAVMGGPLHLRVGSTTEIAMRRSEARLVQINLES